MKAHKYGDPTPLTLANFQMTILTDASAVAQSSPHGWQFDSIDGLYRVKFQRDGFLFSRLGQYKTWELFRGEAQKLWDLYTGVIGDFELTEYGVRYINKLFIPIDEKVSDYIGCYPMLPDDVPTMVLESFMRLVMPVTEPKGKLVHQHVLLAPEKPNFATVLLDNDFRFPATGFTQRQLWDQLEFVRDVKDDYFRKFTTEKMRNTFDAD